MGPKFSNRFARLHEQRFVVLQIAQRTHDCVECFPAPRCPTGPAINNQLVRIFGDVGIEIVHQHPHGGFLVPAFATQLVAARRTDNSSSAHKSSNAPAWIFSATRAMSPDNGRSFVNAGATCLTS